MRSFINGTRALRTTLLAMALAGFTIGCDGGDGGDTGNSDGTGGEATGEDLELGQSAANLAAEATTDLQAGFELDDYVDGYSGGGALLDFVQTRAQRRARCAEITRGDDGLTVDFGDGCEAPRSGRIVQGSIRVDGERVVDDAGLITRDVEVEVVGFGSETTATGSWTVHVERTRGEGGSREKSLSVQLSDGRALDWTGAAEFADGTARFGGDATHVSAEGVTTRVGYDAFSWTFQECWPSAGTATLDRDGQPTVTVTFDEDTPETGEVTVQVGRLPPTTQALPTEHCGRMAR